MSDMPRRRVLYIQQPPREKSVELHRVIHREIASSLAPHADVEVVQGDFDYAEACDRVKPDFSIFEFYDFPQPLAIRNVKARPDIPRAGFHFMDPHGPGRVQFLRSIDHYGI